MPRRLQLLADRPKEELGVGPIQACGEKVGTLPGIEVGNVLIRDDDAPPHLGGPRPWNEASDRVQER
jgi:hypothetical protein